MNESKISTAARSRGETIRKAIEWIENIKSALGGEVTPRNPSGLPDLSGPGPMPDRMPSDFGGLPELRSLADKERPTESGR